MRLLYLFSDGEQGKVCNETNDPGSKADQSVNRTSLKKHKEASHPEPEPDSDSSVTNPCSDSDRSSDSEW